MDTQPLHFDRIPIERHWGLSILLHSEAGCDQLASAAIREIFGVATDAR